MTTTTPHTNSQQPAEPDQSKRIFTQWGLPHTVTPRFGARLIQEHHRLHFLSDRASLIGGWVHIPVENEHLFRFKMNADSGLRVHHFRTPQSTNSDVR